MNMRDHFRKLMLTSFLEEISTERKTSGFVCAVKRLSGNDTGLTGAHQVGMYLPKEFFKHALKEICTTDRYNPDIWISECYIASHDLLLEKPLRAIYYNSKVCTDAGRPKGTRNEFRITRWGGKENPLQNVENTGCLVVFAVAKDDNAYKAVVWLSESDTEDDIIEDWIGHSITGGSVALIKHQLLIPTETDLTPIPDEWVDSTDYPSPKEIFSYVETLLPFTAQTNLDTLLLKRRDLEFSIFQSIESKRLSTRLKLGFSSVEDFANEAKSVLNRRKSRSGASLELQLSSIFASCGLKFETQVRTEGNKKPDFIFPSAAAYHDLSYTISRMTFLASKTCCKDRWRQIINEADRFRSRQKHLFTLQEGISAPQLEEMEKELVSLVVPQPNLPTYHPSKASTVMDLTTFVNMVRLQQSVM